MSHVMTVLYAIEPTDMKGEHTLYIKVSVCAQIAYNKKRRVYLRLELMISRNAMQNLSGIHLHRILYLNFGMVGYKFHVHVVGYKVLG